MVWIGLVRFFLLLLLVAVVAVVVVVVVLLLLALLVLPVHGTDVFLGWVKVFSGYLRLGKREK